MLQQLIKSKRFIAGILSIVILAMSCIILAGWITNTPWMRNLGGENVPIRFNSAILLMFASIALLALNGWPHRTWNKRTAAILGVAISLAGGAVLFQYVLGMDFGIDELLWDQNKATAGQFSGRLPLLVSLCFISLGAAIATVTNSKYQSALLTLLALTAFFSAITIFEAYLHIPFPIAGSGNAAPKPIGILILLLCLALLLSRPMGENTRSSSLQSIRFFTTILIILFGLITDAFLTNHIEQWNLVTQEINAEKTKSALQELNFQILVLENNWRDEALSPRSDFAQEHEQRIVQIRNKIGQMRSAQWLNQEEERYLDSLQTVINKYYDIYSAEANSSNNNAFEKMAARNRLINEALRLSSMMVSTRSEAQLNDLNEQHILNIKNFRIIIAFIIVAILTIATGLVFVLNNLRQRMRAEEGMNALIREQSESIATKTKEIQDKEERYRFLLQHMLEGVQVIGYDWRYHYINDAAAQQIKREADALAGVSISEVYKDVEQTPFFTQLRRAMHDRVSLSLELQLQLANGDQSWFELSFQPIPDGVLVISSNIDKKKEAEKTLNDYKFALDEASIISITDARGSIIYVNDKFCTSSGYFREELLHKNHRLLKSNHHNASFYNDMWQTILSGKVWSGEVCNKNKNGSLIWLETIIVPFMNAQGKPYQFMAFRIDITHRKLIELENARIRKELQNRAEDLQRSNVELEQFAYVASHDLQEPIRQVSSFATLLRKKYAGQLDESAQKYIQFITEGTTRMNQLIKDLLQLSRIHSQLEQLEEIDVAKLLQGLANELSGSIAEAHAKVEWSVLPTLTGKVNLLHQLFENLIKNALKFKSDKPPVISITCIDADTHWQFCVADNGIGIEQEYLEKIFIIFQRLHNNSTYPGTGIGLAISKKIVELHKGCIWASSIPGEGSRFYFTIAKNLQVQSKG